MPYYKLGGEGEPGVRTLFKIKKKEKKGEGGINKKKKKLSWHCMKKFSELLSELFKTKSPGRLGISLLYCILGGEGPAGRALLK